MKILLGLLLVLSFSTSFAHWKTAVFSSDEWKYFIGNTEPESDWKDVSFDDSNWESGNGGFGYEDGDDGTIIEPTISVYLRRTFQIEDLSKLQRAILHADYDDGFVAYLNGIEIARSENLGESGSFVPYFQNAIWEHEAQMYSGGNPESFWIYSYQMESLLQNGVNVLAVQVHNLNIVSSDLSSNFFLAFDVEDNYSFYNPVPDWFDTPFLFEESHLPIVIIDTYGQEIPNSYRIVVHIGIINNESSETNYITDPFDSYDGFAGIEIRGSSSVMFPKKQYAFETQDEFGENLNVPLLGLPTENDWILYAPYSDKTLIRNALAYELARKAGRYASRLRFCELVINDDYKGLYILFEKIKRDDDRVDISEMDQDDIAGDELTGGYILKVDKWDGENNDGWFSAPDTLGEFGVFYQYHYPKADDIVQEQMDYLINYITEFENLMLSDDFNDPETGYYDQINLHSFIHFIMINEISKNIDGYRFSTFMYKDRESIDGRLTLGPVWDFNLAFGNANYGDGAETEGWQIEYFLPEEDSNKPFWIKKIWADSTFRNNFNVHWNLVRESIFSDDHLVGIIDSLIYEIGDAQVRNFERWPILNQYVWPNPFIGGTYENEIIHLKEWLQDRLDWMDLNTLCDSLPETYYDIVINEFMASNQSTIEDPQGDYDDWIEIYNCSNFPVDIGGCFLTDDLSNLTNWQIPSDHPFLTTIFPHEYLLLWADRDSEDGIIHLDFKLSADGEQIGLIAPDGFSIIDSLSFGEQTEDVSFGRINDADSLWQFYENPTPGYSNSSSSTDDNLEIYQIAQFRNYPNPFRTSTTISFEITNLHEESRIGIYNIKGQKVKTLECNIPDIVASTRLMHPIIWDGTDDSNKPVNSGIYFYKIKSGKETVSKKMILMR